MDALDPPPPAPRFVDHVIDRRWLLLAVCLLGVIALRAPSLGRHIYNADEAYVQTEAHVLRNGGHLYRDVVDRKPPGMPMLAALGADLGLPSVLAYRVPALFASAVTASLLALEAKRRFGRRAALPAAGGFLVASVAIAGPSVGQAANEETFVVLAVLGALVAVGRGRLWLAGFALVLGVLARQTALCFAPALLVAAWPERGMRALVPVTVPTLVSLPAVAAVLGWHDYWFWNGFGASAGYLTWPHDLHLTEQFARYSVVPFLAGTAGLLGLALVGARWWRASTDLWVWVAGGIVAAAIGFRFVDHYFLQLLPALALLAAAGWIDAPTRLARVAVAAVALVPAVFTVTDAWIVAQSPEPIGSIVPYVQAHTNPDDSIFVWGSVPELYTRTGRLPATRFVTNGFLTGHSIGLPPGDPDERPVPGAWAAFTDDVRSHPPRLILDVTPSGIRDARSYPVLRYPELEALLVGRYRRVAMVDGIVVYERRA